MKKLYRNAKDWVNANYGLLAMVAFGAIILLAAYNLFT